MIHEPLDADDKTNCAIIALAAITGRSCLVLAKECRDNGTLIGSRKRPYMRVPGMEAELRRHGFGLLPWITESMTLGRFIIGHHGRRATFLLHATQHAIVFHNRWMVGSHGLESGGKFTHMIEVKMPFLWMDDRRRVKKVFIVTSLAGGQTVVKP